MARTDPELPMLTADLPGSGGVLKSEPEDFQVEEVPAYAPCGEGEHLYLWVEKRGRSTPEAARVLSRHLGIGEREISYAGLKDRQGITRQLFSVPARVEPEVASFADPEVTVLWSKRHRNKLKTGHLRGNRFRIRIRRVKDPAAATAVLERLGKVGVPNAFGDQRFGAGDDNAALGKQLLLGKKLAKAPDRFQRKMYLSAYQSLLFNRMLARRLERGELGTALLGDVLKKPDTGGEFRCDNPEVDQPRVERFEVSPAGPIFGPEMTSAGAGVAQEETQLLTEEQLVLEDFTRGRGETAGARRPYRVQLGQVEVAAEGEDLWVSFDLPRGSYATVVLREVMK